MSLTQEQKMKIYCIKHGHSKIKSACFGYISCERCGEQVGDTLGSIYNADNDVFADHIGKNIPGCYCTENYRNIIPKDKKHIKTSLIRKMDIALKKFNKATMAGKSK